MKFALRIIAFSIAALALVYAPAAKADPFTPCTAATCNYTLYTSGTDGSITLYLTVTPLPSTVDYGITSASGTVKLGSASYTVLSELSDGNGNGHAYTVPQSGGQKINNKLWGTTDTEPYIGKDGLFLQISGLTEGNSDNRWILRNVGRYFELVSLDGNQAFFSGRTGKMVLKTR